ncbi:MAG: hypothetical protein A2V81_04170 [Candidatus Abawacabacteria bacterium RBG_16_42_10]|uniref:DNA-binding response regulator n=1 Tax=Candidatus Abawacabacteria bacterium RBG_16_42_10 TaxID=1817814 RepID=A0A1F4XIA4_9BACT|nr:MAG: hypothetical protein A2V81_04170 [Candidatus Abawacabacteria bacterium RBG_16_42_10]
MKILLVEDDAKTAITVIEELKRACHSVDIATTADQALYVFKINHYDCIILDLIIGEHTGAEICRKIRISNRTIPILVYSVLKDSYSKVVLLEAGADDMIGKDSAFSELLARIQALVRRKSKIIADHALVFQSLKIDTLSKAVTLQGYSLHLSAKEYQLLEVLIQAPEKVFSRQEILERIWDMHVDPLTNKVDVYINFLRKKLGKYVPDQEKYLQTVRGFGYRLAWR